MEQVKPAAEEVKPAAEEVKPAAEEIAKNWVTWLDALASGEYKKGTDVLHDDHGRHCCLGVAQLCLGLERTDGGYDSRLTPLLGLNSMSGEYDSAMNLVELNDNIHHDDVDFSGMIKDITEHMDALLSSHPEVPPMIRKILKEREQ